MRHRSRSQRGESQLGCLFGLVLLALGGLIAYKMIPVKVNAAEVRQVVVDEAKSAGTHNDDQIREAILAKAKENGFDVSKDDISITRAQSEITVEVKYDAPIQFPGYVYHWHITHYAHNPIF
jgi:hypothetical protein